MALLCYSSQNYQGHSNVAERKLKYLSSRAVKHTVKTAIKQINYLFLSGVVAGIGDSCDRAYESTVEFCIYFLEH
jgi:hypothetical protein